MSFDEFLVKYNGKYLDYDLQFGPQCFDLLHYYCVEVLGLTDGRILAAPAAKDIYNKYENLLGHELFDKIVNTPPGVPKEGDIVIFSSGQYGHVCIFIEGNTKTFKSFDQNFPTSSPCHVQEHSYSYCLGWLRFKGQPDLQGQLNQCREERDRNWNYFAGLCDIMRASHDFDIAKAELEKLVGIEDIAIQKERALVTANIKIGDLEVELKNLNEQHLGLLDQNQKLDYQIKEQAKTIDKQGDEMLLLSGALQALKEATARPIFSGIRKFIYDLITRY